MSKTKLKIFTIVIVLLFLAYSVKAQAGYTIEKCGLVVYPEGYVLVSMYIRLPEETYTVNVSLIGEPSADYIIFVLDERGEPLAYELKDNVIEVIAVDSRIINITYITASLTYKERDTWLLEAQLPVDSEIVLPEKSLIVELSEIPLLIDMRGESPVLIMPKGFVKIGYIIPPPIVPPSTNQTQEEQSQVNQTTQPSTNQTEISQEESAEQPSQETTKPGEVEEGEGVLGQGGESEFPLFYIVGGAIGVVLIIAVLLLRSRRSEMSEELRYEEVEILNALKALGGRAFQSEIAKMVDQPTTTLWRNIRRLEEKGYIRVEKKFGRNYLTLLKF